VKLSSERAEYLTLTPVVVRDMAIRELIEMMLGVAGKDAARIRELLRRGSLVKGASRFRWEGWDADPSAIASLLATFPDADPSRPFTPAHCVRAVLKGPACRIEIARDTGSERRLLRRRSFWDVLMEIAAAGNFRYVDYSYGERADSYEGPLSLAGAARLRQGARLLRYSSLEGQVRNAALESLELLVARED
jgi:hypothetical protein